MRNHPDRKYENLPKDRLQILLMIKNSGWSTGAKDVASQGLEQILLPHALIKES